MMSSMEKVTNLISDAKRILVLTGAGMSTASGIPDFRSKTGLYSKAPEEILSHDYFFRKTERFYEFLEKNMYFPEAKPNKGHKILTKWETQGKLEHIVTQNIDGLHQKSGSQKVIEFHGTINKCVCRQCKRIYTPSELFEKKEAYKQIMKNENDKNLFYICDECEGDPNKRVIKPEVVLYGEQGYWLSGNPFYDIQCMSYDADLILVLGSTMEVYPFRTIPETRNKDADTQMVIINKGKTPYDNEPWTHVIKEDIGKTLKLIDDKLR